jgi:hypothetical protein
MSYSVLDPESRKARMAYLKKNVILEDLYVLPGRLDAEKDF